MRELGEKLRAAGSRPRVERARTRDAQVLLQRVVRQSTERAAAVSATMLLREVKVAPTLVKYAAPNAYQIGDAARTGAAARS